MAIPQACPRPCPRYGQSHALALLTCLPTAMPRALPRALEPCPEPGHCHCQAMHKQPPATCHMAFHSIPTALPTHLQQQSTQALATHLSGFAFLNVYYDTLKPMINSCRLQEFSEQKLQTQFLEKCQSEKLSWKPWPIACLLLADLCTTACMGCARCVEQVCTVPPPHP